MHPCLFLPRESDELGPNEHICLIFLNHLDATLTTSFMQRIFKMLVYRQKPWKPSEIVRQALRENMLWLCHSQKYWMQVPFNKIQQRNTQSLFWTFINPVMRWAKCNPDQLISAGFPRSSFLEQSPSGSILNRTSPLWLGRVALVMWSESDSQDPSGAT